MYAKGITLLHNDSTCPLTSHYFYRQNNRNVTFECYAQNAYVYTLEKQLFKVTRCRVAGSDVAVARAANLHQATEDWMPGNLFYPPRRIVIVALLEIHPRLPPNQSANIQHFPSAPSAPSPVPWPICPLPSPAGPLPLLMPLRCHPIASRNVVSLQGWTE